MSTFVLVHGAHMGSWSWNLVVSSLQRRGHQAINIELPTGKNNLGAADYACYIEEQIVHRQPKDQIVVVGHASACLIIPLLAEKVSVRKFIYVAPLLPLLEQSFVSRLKAGEPRTLLVPNFPDPAVDRANAFKYWLHDCEPDIAYWAASRFHSQSYENLMEEKSPIVKMPDVSSSLILCANDRLIDANITEKLAKDLLKVVPITIDSGHCPQLSRPHELALLLMQLGNPRAK